MVGFGVVIVLAMGRDIDESYSFRTKTFSYLLLSAIACVIAELRVGDWNIRLAMVSGDDGLEAASFYFARPQDFAADVYMQAWAPMTLSSAASWIPAFAYKYLHIHPLFFFKAFTLGQNVGLALAMFHFAFVISRSQVTAWLAAAMTIWWNPQFWNLALIGGLEWMPYANWIALPFLLLAFASAYQGHRFFSYVALLIGALIHPIMGILATAIVGPFIAYEGLTTSRLRLIIEPAIASAIIAVLAIVPMTISTHGVSFMPSDISSFLDNQHVRPWGAEYPYGVSSFVSSALCIASLVALANTKDRFFIISLAMTCIMTGAHFLGVLLQVQKIMEVIPSRATILLSLVCIPFTAVTFLNAIQSRSFSRIISVTVALFRPNAITLIAAAIGIRSGWILATVSAAVSVAVLALGADGYLIFGAAAPWYLGYPNLVAFSWKLAAVGFVGALLASLSSSRIPAFVVVAALLASARLGGYQTQYIVASDQTYVDYAAAQLWARDSTAPNSTFTLLQTVPSMSWRSLSERPVVSAAGVGTAYRQARILADYNARLNAFYARTGKTYQGKPGDDLGEDWWRAFSEEFGADYMVRPVGWPTLKLPEVYQNSSFRIYRLRP